MKEWGTLSGKAIFAEQYAQYPLWWKYKFTAAFKLEGPLFQMKCLSHPSIITVTALNDFSRFLKCATITLQRRLIYTAQSKFGLPPCTLRKVVPPAVLDRQRRKHKGLNFWVIAQWETEVRETLGIISLGMDVFFFFLLSFQSSHMRLGAVAKQWEIVDLRELHDSFRQDLRRGVYSNQMKTRLDYGYKLWSGHKLSM